MAVYICLALLLAGTVALCLWGNRALTVSAYTYASEKVPEGFSGFRIVQISDLHNARLGKHNERLLRCIEKQDPDIIVLTGDMLYGPSTDTRTASAFAAEAVKLAPVYFVPGNHEARIGQYPLFKKSLLASGVTVLENKRVTLTRGEDRLTLMGIVDPCFYSKDASPIKVSMTRELLRGMVREGDGVRILLSHRPELLAVYAGSGIDLSFTGHAHGGQIRIPGIGGLYAPAQGLLPKYTSGMHTLGESQMVVSRGIGRSAFPLRINNRPEVVRVELKRMHP